MLARRAVLLWAMGGQWAEDFPPPPVLPTPDTPLGRVMNVADSTRGMVVPDRRLNPMAVANLVNSMSISDSLYTMPIPDQSSMSISDSFRTMSVSDQSSMSIPDSFRTMSVPDQISIPIPDSLHTMSVSEKNRTMGD